jgi:hypothetical protein
MDMNRKSRFGLKNKKIQMAASLIQKFVMVLAVFVIMVATAHAGAFLNDFTSNEGVTNPLGLSYNTSNNRRNTAGSTIDQWNGSDGYTALDYTGVYIGTFSGNDYYGGSRGGPNIDLQDLIEAFLSPDVTDVSFLGYAKYEPGESENEGTVTEVTVNSPSTWDWKVDNGNTAIDFYSVKGSSEFALYYIPEGGASEGIYTTAHIGGDLSHFSVVKISYTPPSTSNVPEPATMLLFGFSLIGLAGMARRKNSKF